MIKKHRRELTIVVGLILALLIVNYICLNPKENNNLNTPEISINTKTRYVPMFTELLILSTKRIFKPLK